MTRRLCAASALAVTVGLAPRPATAQSVVLDAQGVPTLTVEIEADHPEVPPGLELHLVRQTDGVPVVLERVAASADQAVASVRLRNVGPDAIARVVLVVTAWRAAGGPPVRRTIGLTTALEPGAAALVPVTAVPAADLAALWFAGETGVVEVAVGAAQSASGLLWEGDVEVPRPDLPAPTAVACGDSRWLANAPGSETTDPASGVLVRCGRDGRWRPVEAR